MSRISRVSIKIPQGVSCVFDNDVCTLKGPRGELSYPVPKSFTISLEDGSAKVSCGTSKHFTKYQSTMLGTLSRLIRNAVVGVSQGFEKKLELIGVGYKAEVKGTSLKMSLGYSHDVLYEIPQGVSVVVEKPTLLSLSSVSKEQLGQTLANLKKLRKADVYKGKGIHIQGTYVRRKQGKTK